MIISASRRTDIPAFYSAWLIKRLQEGYVYVKNPLNSRQIRKVLLNTDVVDCFVFWTKNAEPMMDNLQIIDKWGYPYYFLWTITPYGKNVEPNLPDKEKIVDSFRVLSDKLGKHRTIWRYDPIFVSQQFPLEYHLENFANLCSCLAGYTQKCIFSFIDLYAKTCWKLKGVIENDINTLTMYKIAESFSAIAKQHNIVLETCSEQIELGQLGINHGACINQQDIENIIGSEMRAKKQSGLRKSCKCIESIDIGAYDSCLHGCLYCYANMGENKVLLNMKKHNVNSPLLIGDCDREIITLKKGKSLKNNQINIFL